jgi:hypothetical protein
MPKLGLNFNVLERIRLVALSICPTIISPKDAMVRQQAIEKAAHKVFSEVGMEGALLGKYVDEVRRLFLKDKLKEDFGLDDLGIENVINGAKKADFDAERATRDARWGPAKSRGRG